jgi:hypothetical protein
MHTPQSMALGKILMKITEQWPVALIVVGVALTLVWLAVLIWVPLHLLQVV